MRPAAYTNRQAAPLYWVVILSGVGILAGGILFGGVFLMVTLTLVALITVLFAFMFVWLEISEDEEHLFVRFGPIPGFKKRVRYDSVIGASRGRSLLIEGWGIHFGPRGWVWNIWGRDVVEIEFKEGRVRLGTDDPEGLLAHLKERCGLN